MAQYKGNIAWFNNAKGFGFIKSEGMPDTFVHYSAVQGEGFKTLNEADPVVFDIETGSTGRPQAANVVRES